MYGYTIRNTSHGTLFIPAITGLTRQVLLATGFLLETPE